MNVRRQAKYNARRALTNNWGKAMVIMLLMVAIVLFFMVINGVLHLVAGIGNYFDFYNTPLNYLDDLPDISLMSLIIGGVLSLGMFLVVTPLSLGITGWFYDLSDGTGEDILGVFNCFSTGKMFWRSIMLSVNIAVRTLFWVILLLVPSVACAVGGVFALQSGLLLPAYASLVATVAFVGAFVLGMCGIVGLMITVNKFFLARYYLLKGEYGVLKALKASRKATKGCRGEIFIFHLSFLGWWLSLVFVVPALYVGPYTQMSKVLYARYLIETAHRRTRLAVKDASTEVPEAAFGTVPQQAAPQQPEQEQPPTQEQQAPPAPPVQEPLQVPFVPESEPMQDPFAQEQPPQAPPVPELPAEPVNLHKTPPEELPQV